MSLRRLVVVLGPGLAIAATGVGAGDLMSALIAGARHGTALLWVIAVGAILKFVLNEGVARWQLATGKTVIEGWTDHLGRPVLVYFTAYLAIWGIIVAAGLMAACGVAAHALVPAIPIGIWSVLHSLVALGLVWLGRYEIFEGLMKVLILLMVLTILGSVVLLRPDWGQALASLATPKLPTGSAPSALSLMGGVGGSVTLLSYGYWIREKGWRGQERIGDARIDLGVVPAEHPVGDQAPHPLQGGRGRQPDAGGQLLVREPSILLQLGQDFAVRSVQLVLVGHFRILFD